MTSVHRIFAKVEALAPAVMLLLAFRADLRAQPAHPEQDSLRARMAEFVLALPEDRSSERTRRFFPLSGAWQYKRTVHRSDGRDSAQTWTITVADAPLVFGYPSTRRIHPATESLEINYEAQRPGLLLYTIMNGATVWRLVGANRFVPLGASASSPTYVEWRREGDRWVISAFGDQWFAGR